MSDRNAAISAAKTLTDTGQFQTELAELVAHPTESQNPERQSALVHYLKEAMCPRFLKLGFDCEIVTNSEGAPFLIARRIEGTDLSTVLSYGHGDVVRGQDDQWRAGLTPFKLIQEGERLYGRGSADNKCQHLINLLALETVLKARGNLGFNITFLIEMGEEMGSPGLEAFCEEHAESLSADVLIASDGPRLRSDQPTIFLGARGAINFDLVADLRAGAHHSGNWGGLLTDPSILVAQAIASITDTRGQIAIPDWRPDSLTSDIRETLAKLPSPSGGPEVNLDWGEEDQSPAERAYGWNSFAVLAMTSGVPEAPVNAIAGYARATCQLRFVVGSNPEMLMPALREHLDAHGLQDVQIQPLESGFFPATRSDPNGVWPQRVARSIEKTTGQAPDLLPNLAGSLPNHCFQDILKLPTVWVPHSYGGCNQHAPDEHVLLPLCQQALGVMAGVFWDIGEDGA